jgi:hypothetical protein
MDLSPIQPGFVPANLKFVVDDAEDEWIMFEKFDSYDGWFLPRLATIF